MLLINRHLLTGRSDVDTNNHPATGLLSVMQPQCTLVFTGTKFAAFQLEASEGGRCVPILYILQGEQKCGGEGIKTQTDQRGSPAPRGKMSWRKNRGGDKWPTPGGD